MKEVDVASYNIGYQIGLHDGIREAINVVSTLDDNQWFSNQRSVCEAITLALKEKLQNS